MTVWRKATLLVPEVAVTEENKIRIVYPSPSYQSYWNLEYKVGLGF